MTNLFHKLDELCGVASSLVVLDKLLHVVGVLEDVQPADSSQSELLGTHTGVAHLEPHPPTKWKNGKMKMSILDHNITYHMLV